MTLEYAKKLYAHYIKIGNQVAAKDILNKRPEVKEGQVLEKIKKSK